MPNLVPGTESAEAGESHINDLLGGDLSTETTDLADGDTPVDGTETEVEDAQVETQDDGATDGETETATEDVAEGEAAEGGEESGEEEFDLEGLETDFAEPAYKAAADHWAKRGVQLDPNDPGQRAMLKDWMERGQKIRELSSRAEEHPEEETETDEAKEQSPAEPAKSPQEQFQERLRSTLQYVKESYNPEVAKGVVQPIMDAITKALWPGKDVKINLEGESLQNLTAALSTAMIFQLSDAIPSILEAAPKAIERAYPMFTKVISMAERESAVDELLSAADASGKRLYPGIDRLIENGTIKRIMDTELKEAVFSKDPYKNMVQKAKVAYKMAHGQAPNPELLRKAVSRGREQANERQRRVAAGKLPPGSSGRGFADTSKQSLKESILSGSGSKFGRLLAEKR